MALGKFHIATYLFITIIAALIIAVSGSELPLFDVGILWINAVGKVQTNLFGAITEIADVSSPWFIVRMAVLLVVMYGLWLVLCKPLNRVRKLEDVGYVAQGGLSLQETANLIQKRRKIMGGTTTTVYPNGWFGLMESFQLKKGEAKSISCLGMDLAVFRDEYGVAHVLDAYCPHMGANLAVGGRVKGDCLECPFHAWRFRGEDGKCTHIPYTDKIPDIAKVKSWPVKEVTDWIFLWYHAEGAEPTWDIPPIEEIETGKWIYCGRTEHYVNTHIEDIPENAADFQHFKQIHGPMITAGSDLKSIWNKWWQFAFHNFTATWEPEAAPNGHIGLLVLVHNFSLFGFNLPMLNVTINIRQIGPSFVYMEFETYFGKGTFTQSVIPMAPLTQKIVHNIYASWWAPTVCAKIFMICEAVQLERDLMIWNNKLYEARPMFVKSKEDSLIAKHRRWYSQFYSENSPKVFQKDTLDF